MLERMKIRKVYLQTRQTFTREEKEKILGGSPRSLSAVGGTENDKIIFL
jgi:hypothetical protein